MTLNQEPLDVVLRFEFGCPGVPLELILIQVKPGTPAELIAYLKSFHSYEPFFVYVASEGEIVSAGAYLAKPVLEPV